MTLVAPGNQKKKERVPVFRKDALAMASALLVFCHRESDCG